MNRDVIARIGRGGSAMRTIRPVVVETRDPGEETKPKVRRPVRNLVSQRENVLDIAIRRLLRDIR